MGLFSNNCMQWEHWRSVVYDWKQRISTDRAEICVSRQLTKCKYTKNVRNIPLPLVQY